MLVQRSAIVALTQSALMAAAVPARAADPASYAYVVLGQGSDGTTIPMARVVIAAVNQPCPALTAPGQPSVPMTPRANPNAANFPVTMCEAVYPTGHSYKLGSVALPSVSLTDPPKRVVVLGDSGCRDDSKQACDAKSWPLAELAATAAQQQPDLIVHVGDYNYRGTPGKIMLKGQPNPVHVYDAGDADDEDGAPPSPHKPYYSQNMAASTQPDTWAPWQADFFVPAREALAAAPWIFVRGNHELCSRAGPGFLYFLDPGSKLLGSTAAQHACPDQDGNSPLFFGEPYRIVLGRQAFAVIDTANADDSGVTYTAEYKAQLAAVVSSVGTVTPTWVVTHRPFWGVIKGAKDARTAADTAAVINDTLQGALAAMPGRAFPGNVTLVVSGHMHRFQAMSFGGGRPPQIIAGTGGVALSKSFPKQHKTDPFSMTVAGAPATGVGLSEFGLLRFELGKDGVWTAKLKDPNDKTLAECASASVSAGALQPVCTLK